MQYSTRTVQLNDVSHADRTFIITSGAETDTLERSIANIGLVNAPYLVFSETAGCYLIVCGWRRVTALKNLGWQETEARICPAQTDRKMLVRFAVLDNCAHRTLSPLEQAAAVTRLLNCFSETQVVSHYLPLLGLAPAVRVLQELVTLDRLDDESKQAILQGAVTLKSALKLARIENSGRLFLLDLFRRLNLSSSKQAEIIENCLDIARRDGCAVESVIPRDMLRGLIDSPTLTRSQQGDRLRQWLRQKRFPRLVRLEGAFSRVRRAMALPEGVSIVAPPFFEGSTFQVRIEFDTVGALGTAADSVKQMAQNEVLRDFMEARR